MTESERHKILVKWNNTQSDYPLDKCVHQLFKQQVERTPEGVKYGFSPCGSYFRS